MRKDVVFSKERPEQSMGFVFWQTTLLWQRITSEALKKINLTHVQFVLLAGIGWLTKHHHHITQTMLAKHVKADIMMTSKVLRTLEQKELIKRASHSIDTRAKMLFLTHSGKKILQKALSIVEEIDYQFFSTMGKNQQIFHDHLRNLLTTFE